MEEGFRFTDELGHVFEVVEVTCEIRRQNGETFTLDAPTLQNLLQLNIFTKIEDPKCS